MKQPGRLGFQLVLLWETRTSMGTFPVLTQSFPLRLTGYQSLEQLQPIRMPQIILCVTSPRSGRHAYPTSQGRAAEQKTCRLRTKHEKKISSKQHTLTDGERHQLKSNEANYNSLKAGLTYHCTYLHQSTQYHMVVRCKACVNVPYDLSLISHPASVDIKQHVYLL